MQSHQDNAEVILLIDAGGTFLKSAFPEADGRLVPLPEIPTHSDGSADEIRNAFQTAVDQCLSVSGKTLAGIAIAIPGPFDYRNGVFRMDHKFQAVKNRSIKEFLPEVPLVLLHDANAFAMGLPGSEKGRLGGITLGTGLGSAVIFDGVCQNSEAQTPLNPLWKRPFHGGIAEDRVSTRALLKACPGAKNVKEIAEDPETDLIWQQFGRDLAELLTDWKTEFQLERIVIGGGISKAKDRFLVPELKALPIEFYTGESPALTGLLKEFHKRNQKK